MIKKEIIIGIIVFFNSCNTNRQDNATNNDIDKAFLDKVKTVEAGLSNKQQELVLTGKVECDPDKMISYRPLIS